MSHIYVEYSVLLVQKENDILKRYRVARLQRIHFIFDMNHM